MTYVTNSATRDSSEGHLVPLAAVESVLASAFGINAARISMLGGETDQNMRVQTAEGDVWFARVTEGSADELAWQNAMLIHIETTAPDIPIPRLHTTTDGRVWHEFRGADDELLTLRVMSWLPGRILAEIEHHSDDLLGQFGAVAGRLSAALATMPPACTEETHDWDMRSGVEVVAAVRHAISEPKNAENVDKVMTWYAEVAPLLASLPQSVVHHDLNDANVLADVDVDGRAHISGIVDFGDALYSARVTELAIAVAYAMVRKDDPLAAAAAVVAGFHSVVALTAEELSVVYPMALARLCMNAATWNSRVLSTGSAYGRARMHDTWPTLDRAVEIHPAVAEEAIRLACGLLPADRDAACARTLESETFDVPEAFNAPIHLDLRPASDLWDDRDWSDPAVIAAVVNEAQLAGGTAPLFVPHLHASMLRASRRRPGVQEPSTVQLGTTVLVPAGTVVTAPTGSVVAARRADGALVLRHSANDATYWSTWHGLSSALLEGTQVAAGDALGVVATAEGSGDGGGGSKLGSGVQVLICPDHDLALRAPKFVRPSERAAWARVCPDPAPFLGVPTVERQCTITQILDSRQLHLASSQRNYYGRPMNLVRGRDVWFYDEDAMGYLDSLNNVTHVGHAEPRVSKAAYSQLRKLNTNSRFVYPQITEFAERLVATLPDPLDVVFFVCSGSEANDLAMRITRQVTGRQDIVNIDGAYHGNTGWVTGISPNRYKGPGGQGAPSTTHEVAIPDRYRGQFGYDDSQAGTKYAQLAGAVIDRITRDGRPPAAFIAESLMGTAGNIVHPPGYLAGAFAAARAAGALCISDEVQVGVGRLGPWWGFELQGVVPDIVTMGKPLGNGHPLAALVTTREIANAFDTGMKYFNTFGGNPVSCAIGSTVLDIVERDGLREHAVAVGAYFAAQLRDLANRQHLIGDVRAEGLYLGIELVEDRATKAPGTNAAFLVTELTKERGLVVFPNGVHDNVLKIKPPMTFTREHVDLYVEVLDDVLSIVESMH